MLIYAYVVVSALTQCLCICSSAYGNQPIQPVILAFLGTAAELVGRCHKAIPIQTCFNIAQICGTLHYIRNSSPLRSGLRNYNLPSVFVTVFAKVLFGQTERKCPDQFNEVLKKGYSPAGEQHPISEPPMSSSLRADFRVLRHKKKAKSRETSRLPGALPQIPIANNFCRMTK